LPGDLINLASVSCWPVAGLRFQSAAASPRDGRRFHLSSEDFTRGAADVSVYNAIAKKITEENWIATDDLYSFALPQLSNIQRPMNVHFTPEGSELMARQVAASIESVLPKKN
jgi:lysophospholipase L1-like esterase